MNHISDHSIQQIHCSLCERRCDPGQMSKNQLKKSPEKRRCNLCLCPKSSTINNLTMPSSPSLPMAPKNNLTIQTLPVIVPKILYSSLSPLHKCLTLLKPNVTSKSKKRKLDVIAEQTDDQKRIQSSELSEDDLNTLNEGTSNPTEVKDKRARHMIKLKELVEKVWPASSKRQLLLDKILDENEGEEEKLFAALKEKSENVQSRERLKRKDDDADSIDKESRKPKSEKSGLAKKTAPVSNSQVLKCNKCDGSHATSACPRKKKVKRDAEDELEPKSEKSGLAKKTAPVSNSQVLKCDKCDGSHATSACPHFKKARDNHPDAQKRKAGADIGGAGGNVRVTRGRVVSQPGDGSCLFHSMAFGMKKLGMNTGGARNLRRDIASFLMSHPNTKISETPVAHWIKWDSGMNVQKYCQRMSRGGWGGGIELAGCSILNRVNIHVYERVRGGGLKRISCFDCPGVDSEQTIYVLYCGGMHYDALFLDPVDAQRIAKMDKTRSYKVDPLKDNVHQGVDSQKAAKKSRVELAEASKSSNSYHSQSQHSSKSVHSQANGSFNKKKKQVFGLSRDNIMENGFGFQHSKKGVKNKFQQKRPRSF